MIRMGRRIGIALFALFLTLICTGSDSLRNRTHAQNLSPAERGRAAQAPAGADQKARPRPAAPALDGNTLMEKETALNQKEQEMKKLEQSLDSRIKELENTRKGLEASLERKKKEDSERYKKMLKIYKSLRPEAAAALIDKLDEDIAIEMLNQMDQKTATKLIPYLNQDRVLKWTRRSLKEN